MHSHAAGPSTSPRRGQHPGTREVSPGNRHTLLEPTPAAFFLLGLGSNLKSQVTVAPYRVMQAASSHDYESLA